MKRKIFAILASLLMLTMAGGCNREKNKTANVNIWTYYNDAQLTAFKALVDEFNETVGAEKNIFVTTNSYGSVDAVGKAVMDSADNKIGSDPLPSMFTAYADTAFYLDNLGKVASLDSYFTKDELGEYVEGYLEEGRFGDGTLKIFPTAKSTENLFLNKTDWDKFAASSSASLESLKTIEGVVTLSEQYYNWTKSTTGTGKAFFGWDAMANYMLIGAKQLGQEIFRFDEQGNVIYNLNRTAMKKLWDNFYVPLVKGYFCADSRFRTDDMWQGSLISFVGSSTSTQYFGSEVKFDENTTRHIERASFEAPVFDGAEGVAVQQGAGMAVVKSDSKTEKACVEFLKWFTESERNLVFSMDSGYLPVKKAATTPEKISEYLSDKNVDALVKETLVKAATTVSTKKMFTSKPFENSYDARMVLENSMLTQGKTALKEISELVEAGTPRDQAQALYLTDAKFDLWLASLEAALLAL